MRRERHIQNIPDELSPEMISDADEETQAEIFELHSKLRMQVDTNTRRKRELFEKHGIMLNGDNELAARVNLLIEMFIGVLSPERLRFELQWQNLIQHSLELSYAEHMEAKRKQNGRKTLHLPGGKAHHVDPAEPEEDEDVSE